VNSNGRYKCFYPGVLIALVYFLARRLESVDQVLQRMAGMLAQRGPLFPVYGPPEIEQALRDMRRAYDEMELREEEARGAEEANSEAAARARRAAGQTYDCARATVHYLIEGNIRVLTGKATIDEVMRDFFAREWMPKN
jgi:hypothetical protein